MTSKRKGIGAHQSAVMGKDEWLTPPKILKQLGEFDLDPCSPIVRPWPTAKNHLTIMEDGLQSEWIGRVWCNPPYGLEAARLKDELRELAYIMTGLREATKKWQSEYGAQNRAAKEYWEDKADGYINKHKVYLS